MAPAVGLLACQVQQQPQVTTPGPPLAEAPTAPVAAVVAMPSGGLEVEEALLARIREEIGAAACRSNDECRSLPVGAKACGGPAAWWPWSAVQSDGARLQAWALELERLQRERIARSGRQSNCQFVADPGAVCVAQRCVLQTRKGAV